MPNLTEQEYNKLKSDFEKYLKETRDELITSAKIAGVGGFSYVGGNVNSTMTAYGDKDVKSQLTTSTPIDYINSITNVIGDQLNREDLHSPEDKSSNLIWCMAEYQQHLRSLGEGLDYVELNPREGCEYNLAAKNPLLKKIEDAIKGVTEIKGKMKIDDVDFSLGELQNHKRKCSERFYLKMIEDKAFCERAERKAQGYLDSYANDVSSATYTVDEVQNYVDIVIVAERIAAERKNAEQYSDMKLKKPVRDMYKPNPIFEAGSESTEYEKTHYVNEILIYAHKDPDFGIEQAAKKRGLLNAAQKVDRDLGKFSLNDRNDENKARDRIYRLGAAQTLKLDADDLKAVSSTGSPEYTRLHNACASYLLKRRIPGSDIMQEEKHVYEESMDYLFKKKSRPFTQDGKDRVKAAVKLFTETALHQLSDPHNQDKSAITAALKVEMLRSRLCREMVNTALSQEGNTVPENLSHNLREFAASVEPYADEHGIALNGILEEKGTRRVLDVVSEGNDVGEMLRSINGKPAPVINAPTLGN